ncbi:nucleoside-diphosphate kinase [Archaeoglobales archaeon ex4484_92]|nr:MAG: nucleoside-diphosphate kinase [Archaeoglobales archaeon ex4484_92]
MERSFIMIKPDGVQRALIGEIIRRIERKGLKIIGLKMIKISKEIAKRHYEEHKDKAFFDELIKYITSGPVVVMVVEGREAIKVVRKLVGSTNPVDASFGTIRGDFGLDIGRNIIHASDSKESASREISLFFSENEILEYNRIDENWIYERNP